MLLRRFMVVCLPVLLQACASYGHHELDLRKELLRGQPVQALAVAEKNDPKQEKVIYALDKGMLRRINGKYAASNRIFEVAKKEINALYGISISENLASVTINDTLRGYEGDRYEQLLLHAFMAMNYIQLNELDAARVEMLQAGVKMQEWGGDTEVDAFTHYLAGLIYEALNEPDDALISYRKAYKIYRDKKGTLYPYVPLTLKKDLLRQTARLHLWNEYRQYKKIFQLKNYHLPKENRKTGELVIIFNNGLAPVRSESIIPLFSSEVQKNLHIAIPVYRSPKQPLAQVKIRIDNQQATLETVEDIDSLARHALSAAMPKIMARATARAVVKYNSQHTAQNESSLAGLLMTVTNMITERADTRSWSTLPEEIQLQRLRLPVGKHKLEIDIFNSQGNKIDSISNEVEIKPDHLTFAINHWIARTIKIAKIKKKAVTTKTITTEKYNLQHADSNL